MSCQPRNGSCGSRAVAVHADGQRLADRAGGVFKREVFRREIVRVNRGGRRLERPDGFAFHVREAGVKIERQDGVRGIVADEPEESFFALDVNQLLINAGRDVDDDGISRLPDGTAMMADCTD